MNQCISGHEIAVIDFETTGQSAGYDRPTEIAVAIVRDGMVADKFQSLMNPGRCIPGFVQSLTGITNEMVASAPSVKSVMIEASRFVGSRPLIAHNASFDRRFWQAELDVIGRPNHHDFACTMLLARRVYPRAANHKLGTLSAHLRLPATGRAHRAMADVLTTVALLARIQDDLSREYKLPRLGHDVLRQIQACSKHAVPAFLRGLASRQAR
jgi:DNA polymerase-3 subunit epsilon